MTLLDPTDDPRSTLATMTARLDRLEDEERALTARLAACDPTAGPIADYLRGQAIGRAFVATTKAVRALGALLVESDRSAVAQLRSLRSTTLSLPEQVAFARKQAEAPSAYVVGTAVELARKALIELEALGVDQDGRERASLGLEELEADPVHATMLRAYSEMIGLRVDLGAAPALAPVESPAAESPWLLSKAAPMAPAQAPREPTARSDRGVLKRLREAAPGAFIIVKSRQAIQRLRDLGWDIERAQEVDGASEDKGYRLKP